MKKFKYLDTELQSILTQFHGMKAYQCNLSGCAPAVSSIHRRTQRRKVVRSAAPLTYSHHSLYLALVEPLFSCHSFFSADSREDKRNSHENPQERPKRLPHVGRRSCGGYVGLRGSPHCGYLVPPIHSEILLSSSESVKV